MRRLKDTGIKTIVSLEDEKISEEGRQIGNLGMTFESIPLSVYRRPTEEELERFLDILTDKKNQPVFVHCGSGRDRTGAMIAVYRIIVSGWTIKQAYKEAKQLGFWPYYKGEELKKFIHQIKDSPIYKQKDKFTP